MSLTPKSTRTAGGASFDVLFEDNGDPNGPVTPASVIVGDALVAMETTLVTLQSVLSALDATLEVQFPAGQPQQISGTVDFVPVGDLPVVAAGNLPVVDGTASLVFTTASGTSTGAAIALLTANANRRAFQFQNASDTDFTVNFDGTASASAGFLVTPGEIIEFYGAATPKGAVSIFCGASSKRYVCRVA